MFPALSVPIGAHSVSVAEYIGELNYNAGYRKGYKACKNRMEGGVIMTKKKLRL